MKGKYMLFAYDDYYPGGGMNDYKFSFNGWHDFIKQIDGIQKFDGYEVCDKELKVIFFKSLEKLLEWVEGLENG